MGSAFRLATYEIEVEAIVWLNGFGVHRRAVVVPRALIGIEVVATLTILNWARRRDVPTLVEFLIDERVRRADRLNVRCKTLWRCEASAFIKGFATRVAPTPIWNGRDIAHKVAFARVIAAAKRLALTILRVAERQRGPARIVFPNTCARRRLVFMAKIEVAASGGRNHG